MKKEYKKYSFTIKKLIKQLKVFPPNTKVFVSSDEELNTLYEGFEVSVLAEVEKVNIKDVKEIVIYPLSGLEKEGY